ncbi:MAG: dihydrolipoyllysine-residue succinyltransferase [Coxiellaceae bacterium]|nr:dihydrolipoyllysine-residue succinyltransferase [Coxiellaceae bacterium]|tara:strand:+ start:1781 stop:2953 length:1173 start_codon:yes stop_codon:yes gene_type:complete
MSIEIKVPALPESVADATVAKWYKKAGDPVSRDENLVDLETDKIMLEVPAPQSGVLKEILHTEGETVTADQVLALIEEGEVSEATHSQTQVDSDSVALEQQVASDTSSDVPLSPSARRALAETGTDVSQVAGTGKDGRITKEDVLSSQPSVSLPPVGMRAEERVPMSRLRARVAERLVEVQQSAAILTTFNEVNMKPVMDLRNKYKEAFEKTHGVRLGFMSFFTKAAVEALKRFPAVNASIDGSDIIYHHFYDVGIAIGSERGLVVPILRNVENMSMADVEQGIRDYAGKAKTGKLALEDMQGGTFTITNGGVFGSMLSTPIINPPQTAILGMHNIVERPIVENGEIVARPVMYLALSYDHRVIDGRESVLFLKTIKDLIEDPSRLLLAV